jgi:imidazolonepropionase-like amidohydrolase
MKAVVPRLYEAGVRIHVGSDTPNPFVVPGVGLHEELSHLVAAGLTPEEVWVAATRWAGETLGMSKLGTVQEGAPADFLLFREDPSRDLTALSTLEAVVAQGRLYPKAVLDAALARQRDYFNGWLYDRLSMVFARWMVSRTSRDER